MKKTALIFVLAFLLNFLWEHAHSFLYEHYKGGDITGFILLRAALADAAIITLLSLPFVFVGRFRGNLYILVTLCVLVSVFIELYALQTGRWAYNDFMPLVPLLSVGLTPTIQLGLLGYVSYRLSMGKATAKEPSFNG